MDLFTAAGIALPEAADLPLPRCKQPAPPAASERAASGRLKGARRSRPAPRDRVGPPRRLGSAEVLAFPFSANGRLLREAIQKLPHGYDDKLDTSCAREARNLANRLIRRGLPKQIARVCANDLLHHAYMKLVHDAHKEAGVL